jgi:hypothetical protein
MVRLPAQARGVPLNVGEAAARKVLIDAMSGGGGLHEFVDVVATVWRAYDRMPAAARGPATTAAFAWVKTWIGSPAFRSEYTRVRDEHRPAGAAAGTPTVDEELKKLLDEQSQGIAEARKMAESLPPADRPKFLAQIKEQEDQLRDPKRLETLRAVLQAQRGETADRADKTVVDWNANYPADPDAFVKKWLDRIMTMTANLDFDLPAIVIRNTRGEMLGFLSPGYSALPWESVYAIAAGRDAVIAARAAVAAWLKELGGS